MKKLTKREVFEAGYSKALYQDLLPLMLDPIEIAQNEFKKRGGKVTVLPYRKSRKNERLVKVGVRN